MKHPPRVSQDSLDEQINTEPPTAPPKLQPVVLEELSPEGGQMAESLLPKDVLNRASRQGNEYAWRLSDVPVAIAAARDLGLATLGGQVQFRTPTGICELYWLNADADARRQDESWPEYVVRSAEQVLQSFDRLVSSTDFVSEALAFAHLTELRAQSVRLEDFLCFVLYFETQPTTESN